MNLANLAIKKPETNVKFDYDAIVIGAGMSGLYLLYRLRELGLRVRVFEAGTDIGGTWYWNRYPGARFDSESYSYGYSFSQELLNEWNWSEHFASQPEVERYLKYVTEKFDLRRDIQLSSRVSFASFDRDNCCWIIILEDGSRYTARFLVTALGLLSAPTMPRFDGMKAFRGTSLHTGLWSKEEIRFEGKRVAVIGTGASGVQTIQEVAKTAEHLTVFQRRPNWCTPLNNRVIDKSEMDKIRLGYPELFDLCSKTAACFIHTVDPRSTFEVTPEERDAFWEELYAGPGFGIWQGNFRDILIDPLANKLISDFVAAKIRGRVKDQKIANMLIPTDHGFGTRRVPQESYYYEVFNQSNVKLVSMLESPIKCITPTGLKTNETEFEFDIIIYATGFDAVTGSFDRIDIRGEDGRRLTDQWRNGPKTFVGVMAEGFPNMFMVMGPHAALGNNPRSIEYNVEWVRDLIDYMTSTELTFADARPEAVKGWSNFVAKKAEGLLSNEIDSWMTGVNMNVEGKQERTLVRYSGSAPEYRAWCDKVAEGNYKELKFR